MAIQKIIYAGHSAVFLQNELFCVAIDPWLEGNPTCPENLKSPKQLDLIVLTHGHADHASDVLRLSKLTGAKIAATWELAVLLGKAGVPEGSLLPMNKGGSIQVDQVKVTLTHAMHSSSYDAGQGPAYAGEPCGVVVDDGRRRFYHAGDTALFSDMELIGERYRPEVAFLPIGDCFTMGPEEAALATKFIECKTAIPIHWGTFGLLTGTPAQFSRACSRYDVEVVKLDPGQTLDLK